MEQRQEELQNKIRSLTKKIGIEKKEFSFNELSNLRNQRDAFAKKLIEEFGIYYAIDENGKTVFLNQEEAEEFFSDTDNVSRLKAGSYIEKCIVDRNYLVDRLDFINNNSAEKVVDFFRKQTEGIIAAIESNADKACETYGMKKIDFSKVDEKFKQRKELLSGIDFDSLLDDYTKED